MITVIDYGLGNVGSILNMAHKAGGQLTVTREPGAIADARKLILPGVGAFDRGMANLHELGLVPAMNHAVLKRKVPILGVCLGVQLFTRRSEEGNLPGLGWIAADTVRFRGNANLLKVPHMGWNFLEVAKSDPLLNDLTSEPRFYFVHSYYIQCDNPTDVLAWATHGDRFVAAVRSGNIWGTQFHPEKSHKFGLVLMRNFVELETQLGQGSPETE